MPTHEPRTVNDINCWLTDMDGVLVHENQAIPGAAELIGHWVTTGKRFLVLTNNSIYTPATCGRDCFPRVWTFRKRTFGPRPWQPLSSCAASARVAAPS